MQPCAPFGFEIKDSNGALKDAKGYYTRKQMIGADLKKITEGEKNIIFLSLFNNTNLIFIPL